MSAHCEEDNDVHESFCEAQRVTCLAFVIHAVNGFIQLSLNLIRTSDKSEMARSCGMYAQATLCVVWNIVKKS